MRLCLQGNNSRAVDAMESTPEPDTRGGRSVRGVCFCAIWLVLPRWDAGSTRARVSKRIHPPQASRSERAVPQPDPPTRGTLDRPSGAHPWVVGRPSPPSSLLLRRAQLVRVRRLVPPLDVVSLIRVTTPHADWGEQLTCAGRERHLHARQGYEVLAAAVSRRRRLVAPLSLCCCCWCWRRERVADFA